MDKTALISSLAENEEEKIKFAHLTDCAQRRDARNVITHTAFFGEGERMRGERLLHALFQKDFFFWGGFDSAERRVAVFLPDYFEEEDVKNDLSLAGIVVIRAEVDRFYKEVKFTHRDVLGSLMALQIERETVGDILVGERAVEFAVSSKVSPFILQSLERIGRFPVTLKELPLFTLTKKEDFEEGFDTVASMRLDAVVASVFSTSRSISADAISSGAVSLDGIVTKKCDADVGVGASITFRGKGRARIEKTEGFSKKGRVRIIFKKYK